MMPRRENAMPMVRPRPTGGQVLKEAEDLVASPGDRQDSRNRGPSVNNNCPQYSFVSRAGTRLK